MMRRGLRYLFDAFALDIGRRELRREGAVVSVEPQVFDLLAYLVQHRDRVVTKDVLLNKACRLADRAVAAASDNSTCLASATFTYGVMSKRFDEAFDLANRAVALHPNSVLVRYRTAAAYAVCGESDTAIAQREAASRLSPLVSKKIASATLSTSSCGLYFAGRYEECLDAGRRALTLAPQNNDVRKYVAMSLVQFGRTRDARAEMDELVKRQAIASVALFQLQGFRHKWMHELHLEGLRMVGLREE